ncbi:hypothetical protein [Sinomonas atrocyanea]|uniref:hypothetical protein n=1 Tax=Sinomonas atrocyanea TaxID=37927 RepID=UPI00278BA96E|nr:hypothetical protein [Sinomonas atrocyanea]MDQ0258281.1 hypothetical protein [Sinomonas atrocyanea]MDR6620548.1 hypothetical protein [Sinomonas atrocyanea]
MGVQHFPQFGHSRHGLVAAALELWAGTTDELVAERDPELLPELDGEVQPGPRRCGHEYAADVMQLTRLHPRVVTCHADAPDPGQVCGLAHVDQRVVSDPRWQEHPLERRRCPVRDPRVGSDREKDPGAFPERRRSPSLCVDAAAPALKVLRAQPAQADARSEGIMVGEGPIPKIGWQVLAYAHAFSLLQAPSELPKLSTGTRRR